MLKTINFNLYAVIFGLGTILFLPLSVSAQTGGQIFTSDRERQAQITARGQECVKNFQVTNKKSGEVTGMAPSRKECKAQKVKGQKCVKKVQVQIQVQVQVQVQIDANYLIY
jgi:hypothetical protein